MTRKPFRLFHSLAGISVLLIIEAINHNYLGSHVAGIIVVLCSAAVGGAAIVVIATEVIEQVRNARHMLILLSAVVFEFIFFFAFQYYFFLLSIPGSFQDLLIDPASLLLQSTMVFVFNPLFIPVNSASRVLLLINTMGSLVLVLFVLQNIWQFRAQTLDSSLEK